MKGVWLGGIGVAYRHGHGLQIGECPSYRSYEEKQESPP